MMCVCTATSLHMHATAELQVVSFACLHQRTWSCPNDGTYLSHFVPHALLMLRSTVSLTFALPFLFRYHRHCQ